MATATATAVFGASFSRPEASAASADAAAPFAASRAASVRALFALGDDYGDEAAREMAEILRTLQEAGFAKASASDYSVFDRILGGVCWLLQRLVKREDAEWGRVQWELLFQPHDKMKPRLGLAQDVVSRIHRLPLAGAQQHLQPHQLLLQDFGDIGAVRRLIEWLVACQRESAVHLETICTAREYLEVVVPTLPLQMREPLKREVVYLQRAYQPRRRYQYASTQDDGVESEDALIQKCLLEYGERVAVDTVVEPDGQGNDALTVDGGEDPHKSLMAQLAAASVASMARRTEGSTDPKKVKTKSKDVREFEAQYQRILQQAMVEQTALLEKQRAREAELLRQVVSVPEMPLDDDTEASAGSETSTDIKAEQTRLHDQQVQLTTLEDVKQRLQKQRDQLETEELVMIQAMEGLQAEKEQLEMDERASEDAQPLLSTLRNLVAKNEALKKQKSAFKATCKTELEALQVRVAQLQQQTKQEAAQQDEETLRLHEIEQMHTQMASKHKDLRIALARQTRELQKRMKQIDEVPTRIELVQYEKRFLELYDEVALTLDETRKYFSVYNTLKTTHEFLEKEISLINSMHDNFDVAMASKPATQAFFSQLDGIIQNVEASVRKQQTLRADHQLRVETLDSKYQLLLEKERAYVNAIREFQKECEKNEKLYAKLAQYQRLMQQANVTSGEDLTSGVSLDDVVI